MACASNIDTTTPTTRISRLDGIGARVIRGIDWKWGKQVKSFLNHFYNGLLFRNFNLHNLLLNRMVVRVMLVRLEISSRMRKLLLFGITELLLIIVVLGHMIYAY